MTKPNIEQALSELQPKKKAAQVREFMPLIEQKLAAGVSMDDIISVLAKAGIAINKPTLKTYLYRYRKTKEKGSLDAGAKTAAVKSPKPVNPKREPEAVFPDMSPEKMDYYESLATEEA